MAHHAQGALFFISADAAIFKMLGVLVVLGATFLWVTILLLRRVRWHNDLFTASVKMEMMTMGNMRQNTSWHFLVIVGWMLIMGLPTFAQNWPPPPSSPRDPIFEKLRPDEIIKQAQERFKKAQKKEQVESVKMWCKDMIAELTFNEAGRLLLEAKTLLDAHKTVEATSRIERLQALDEATKRLASEVCKPD